MASRRAASLLTPHARAFGERFLVCHSRGFASLPTLDLNTKIQKARTWDEGLSSEFKQSTAASLFKGRRVVVVGLPGAFTGVCTKAHVPGYVKHAKSLKEKKVDEIIILSVNDPYCMEGWRKAMNVDSSQLSFYADFDGTFTKSLGLSVDLTGALMGPRSTRYSMLVEDGKITKLNKEATPAELKVSDAETILKQL
eukprot:jgi/Mesvir1/10078/Mv21654-RA.1